MPGFTCTGKTKRTMCDDDTRESYTRQPKSYARHGRVTTRATGGATELLGMDFFCVYRALWTSMARLGYPSGIIGFGRAGDFCSASLLGELKVDVVRNPISRYRSRGTSTCIAYRTPGFCTTTGYCLCSCWRFKYCMKLHTCFFALVPHCLLFLSSSLSRLFLQALALLTLRFSNAPPRFAHKKNKSQLPKAYLFFSQGIGPGDYEEKELEEGCGEIQLCWSLDWGMKLVVPG